VPCFHPLKAGRSKVADKISGKHRIVFNPKWTSQYEEIQLPCGRCKGCRNESARQWAVRICHEAQLYQGKNSFITLTFDDKRRKYDPSLNKRDFMLFMKRLRKHYYGNAKSEIRYFHCAEYGKELQRPHHHAILFNFVFPDQKLWQDKDGEKYFRSETLEKLWPFGNSVIGAVSYASAAYVSRYVVKKVNGKLAPDHYQGRMPEFITMSRRPGIAREWYEKYKNTDVFPRDYIVLNGVKGKVPKFYNKCYELTNPEEYGTIRKRRIDKAKVREDNQPDRLVAAEKIMNANYANLTRKFEDE